MNNPPLPTPLLKPVNISIRIVHILRRLGAWLLPVQRELVRLRNCFFAVDLAQEIAEVVLRGRELFEPFPFAVEKFFYRAGVELLFPNVDIDGARPEAGFSEGAIHAVDAAAVAAHYFVDVLLVENFLQAVGVVWHSGWRTRRALIITGSILNVVCQKWLRPRMILCCPASPCIAR